MEQYERELYNELSKEENFKQVMKLRSFYDDVLKPEIITSFWEKVTVKLNDKIKSSLTDWKVWVDKGDCIYFYKKQWIDPSKGTEDQTPLAIVWKQLKGKPFYGVELYKTFGIDFEKWRQNIEIPTLSVSRKTNDKNFLIWDYYNSNVDFQAQNTLVDFLPEFQDSKAEEFANILIEIGQAFEQQIDQLISEYKLSANQPESKFS